MPSVEKPNISTKEPLVDPIWGAEPFWMWFVKFGIQIILFFTILITIIEPIVTKEIMALYFLAIFGNYIITGLIAFFGGYLIVKLIFNKGMKWKVQSIKYKLKGKRMKKAWIYLFTCLFQAMFFVLAIYTIVAMNFAIYEFWALVITWIILSIISKILSRLSHLIFTQYGV